MKLARRNLPIGIQTFSQIISGGYYYADKTCFALALAQQDKYYFLSRPRRFGKSLFLDTLKELFEGQQDLFKGLYIADKWDWSQRFPVIRISFGGGNLSTIAYVERNVHQQLEEHERQFNLPARYPDVESRFRDLIGRVHEQSGQPTVVLIDEYDKPILDNITDHATALALREWLKNFYGIIKDADRHIRLGFLTGVSKFSKVSLFSGLNNLRDITLSPEFSTICGYTDQDVDTLFASELDGLDRNEIKRWYNGYNWRGASVYNPFDLLLLFREREFDAYWFQSGTPTFLIKMLTERKAWLPELETMEADSNLLSSFDIGNISTAALMFQAGYLTIGKASRINGSYLYQLRFPNEEVRQSLYGSLVSTWTADAGVDVSNRIKLIRILAANDLAALKGLFQAFFSNIPHQWYTQNPIARYEGYYASVVYAYFVAAGFDVRVEDSTSFGRIDMSLKYNGRIYLFEFKVIEQEPVGSALQQIKDKGYADKFRADGMPIHLIGVEFSKEKRNVTGFEFETIL